MLTTLSFSLQVQYCGLLFRHEGWPLCIHEKIVVQLASIDWRILKPGDFYLQVVPYLKKSPRIVLKCLARDNHNVEEVVIPEVSYTSIFTLEWLSTFNGERMGIALENCLLTTDDKIFRVPWDQVVNPEFINKPKIIENSIISPEVTEERSVLCPPMDHAECRSPDLGSPHLQEKSPHRDNSVISSTAPQFSEALINGICTSPVPQEDLTSDLEGEYVELTEVSLPRFGPQTGSLTQSLALNYLTQPRTRVNAAKGKHRFIIIQDSTYSKNLIQSALVQKEHCQMDTLRTSATEGPKNVILLESNKFVAPGELSPEGQLIAGDPGNMGNSFPGAESPACSAEDSSAEQESHSEHASNWPYALCSYSDVCAGDGVNCKAQMPGAPGNMEEESDGPGRNPGVETSEQSPEPILDAAAKEETMLRECGEPLTEAQNEGMQMDASPVPDPEPVGPLREGSDVSCQNGSESVVPVQAAPSLIVPECSAVDVESGSSPSGNTADMGAVSTCCNNQETNLSSPLNPPDQNQGEVDEIELGRRDSLEEVKEVEQILTANENQTSRSHCCVEAPADGEQQEESACQHQKAEEAVLLPTAPSAEGDQVAEQSNHRDSLGPDAQAEGAGQFRTQRECSGERGTEELQRQAENKGCEGAENSVLNPEHAAVQDLQGRKENQESFSYGEKSKTVALKTLESIEEELEAGPLSSGPAEEPTEPSALHSPQEAAAGAATPKGTATGVGVSICLGAWIESKVLEEYLCWEALE